MHVYRISDVINCCLGIDVSDIHHGSTLEELGADSMDKFEILVGIEEEFDIMISDDDWKKLRTVSEIAKYVEWVMSTNTADMVHG